MLLMLKRFHVGGWQDVNFFFSTEVKSIVLQKNHKHLRNTIMTWKSWKSQPPAKKRKKSEIGLFTEGF